MQRFEISMNPDDLKQLVEGSKIIHRCLGGEKGILSEEKPTIAFAYASVVTIKPIKKGEKFSPENIWVKRPGTGEVKAEQFENILGKLAATSIDKNVQIKMEHIVLEELAEIC